MPLVFEQVGYDSCVSNYDKPAVRTTYNSFDRSYRCAMFLDDPRLNTLSSQGLGSVPYARDRRV